MNEILNKILTPIGITIVLVLIILGWVVRIYNILVQKKLSVDSAWSDISTQLKKRFDLIPNLISTVKGYAKHENKALNDIVAARAKAGEVNINIKDATPEQMVAFQASQGELSNTLGKLFALSESYPDLKANENFLDLQKQLKSVEEDLNMARRFYNGVVKEFNESIKMFPSNIVAKIFGFKESIFFEIDDIERENVKVEF